MARLKDLTLAVKARDTLSGIWITSDKPMTDEYVQRHHSIRVANELLDDCGPPDPIAPCRPDVLVHKTRFVTKSTTQYQLHALSRERLKS